MKIKNIALYILKVPLKEEKFYSSQCIFPERNSLLLRIETDDGIIGWGEGGQYGPAEPVVSCIENVLSQKLLERNPIEKGKIQEELYNAIRDFGRKGPYIEAISAIDIALWDIVGKAFKKPIYQFLGGAFWDSLPVYATGCYYRESDIMDYKSSLSRLGKEAEKYILLGFKIVKMKIGLLSLEEDIERVAIVRSAIGDKIILLVDCNHSYNAFTAVRMGGMLEKYDVRWMEEPVLPEDKEGYRKVRKSVNIAIAGGECEYLRYGFKDLIVGGCVDIIQPDICVCGGITEIQKILALASCYGIWIMPHVWGSGVAFAAALQFLATIPPFPHTAKAIPLQNKPVMEFDKNYNPLRDNLLKQPFELKKDGCVSVPEGDGLGIEIDEAVLKKYCVYKKIISGKLL